MLILGVLKSMERLGEDRMSLAINKNMSVTDGTVTWRKLPNFSPGFQFFYYLFIPIISFVKLYPNKNLLLYKYLSILICNGSKNY